MVPKHTKKGQGETHKILGTLIDSTCSIPLTL
jgi:hypothetical protein